MKMNLPQIYQGESLGIKLSSDIELAEWSITVEIVTTPGDYAISCAYPAEGASLPIVCGDGALKIQIPATECAKLSEGIVLLQIAMTRGDVVKMGTLRLAQLLPRRAVADRKVGIEHQLVFIDADISLSLDMGPAAGMNGFSPVVVIIEGKGSTVLEITDAEGVKRTRNLQTPANLVQAPGDSQTDAMSQAATMEAIVSEQRRAESAEQTLSESIDKAAAAALSGAKIYTDEAVAAIPTPDVSGQISDHNAAEDAHADIRQQVGKKENAPIVEQIAGAVATLDVVGGHAYVCEELTSLTLSMVEDSPREAVIRFRSGATATSLSIPLALRTSGYWAITANKSYEISIAGNLAVLAAFE